MCIHTFISPNYHRLTNSSQWVFSSWDSQLAGDTMIDSKELFTLGNLLCSANLCLKGFYLKCDLFRLSLEQSFCPHWRLCYGSSSRTLQIHTVVTQEAGVTSSSAFLFNKVRGISKCQCIGLSWYCNCTEPIREILKRHKKKRGFLHLPFQCHNTPNTSQGCHHCQHS